jgi:hypothetical protein
MPFRQGLHCIVICFVERLHWIANSAVVNLLFGKAAGSVLVTNGNQQALTAARLAFIELLSSDC